MLALVFGKPSGMWFNSGTFIFWKELEEVLLFPFMTVSAAPALEESQCRTEIREVISLVFGEEGVHTFF